MDLVLHFGRAKRLDIYIYIYIYIYVAMGKSSKIYEDFKVFGYQSEDRVEDFKRVG